MAIYSSCYGWNFFSAKTQFLSSLNNRGVSLSCAVDWNGNERYVCTSLEFWQLILLVLNGIFFCQKTEKSKMYNRGVSLIREGVSLSRDVDWNVNVRFVCTCLEFWQLIFLVLD